MQIILKVDQIDSIRRAHAQRHGPISGQSSSQNFTKRDRSTKTMVCQFFNHGSCLLNPHMRRKGCYIAMFVIFISQKMAKLFHTQRWSVKTKQNIEKANKLGRASVYFVLSQKAIFLEQKLQSGYNNLFEC